MFVNCAEPDVVQTPTPNSTLIASYRSGENQLIEPNIKSQQRHIGSISDYDPDSNSCSFNKQYQAMQEQLDKQKKILQQQKQQQNQQEQQYQQQYQRQHQQNHQQNYQQKQENHQNNKKFNIMSNQVITSVFRAIYDYDAKEDDEISFRDGDKFINCEQIDVGWMIGVHERTGKHGMIPFNYAEPIDLF